MTFVMLEYTLVEYIWHLLVNEIRFWKTILSAKIAKKEPPLRHKLESGN